MYRTCFGVNGKTGVPDSKVICDDWLENMFFFSLSVVKTRLFEMRNYAALTLITSVVPRSADIPLVRK